MRNIIEKSLREFSVYLYEEEKSENTIKKYLRDVRVFINAVNNKEINKATVLEYKKLLCDRYSPKSVNSMLSSLNAFFAFCGWHHLKVRTLKIQRQIFAEKSREMTKGEYEKLLSAAKKSKNERLYYLMQTIGSTGIRISELKYITCEAVRKGQAVINSKGKLRQIFLPKQLCRMLTNYVKKRSIRRGAVFITRNGNPMDRSNIWDELKKLCKVANVPEGKVFPHNFRHLFARTYYSIERDIVRLADVLGHSSINTTRIYTMESGEVHRIQLQQLGLLRI